MCFLKHVVSRASTLSIDFPRKSLPLSQEIACDQTAFVSLDYLTDSHSLLMNCLQMMSFSSAIMANLDSKLDVAQKILTQSVRIIEHCQSNSLSIKKSDAKLESSELHYFTKEPHSGLVISNQERNYLREKLFGNKIYAYQLILKRAFADTLYKERNFSLGVELIHKQSGQKVRNGNIMSCCLCTCDSQGKWINETKDGHSFIKGKIETELLHGEAQFLKLSPRDVSRCYPGKVINFVIYAKPSLLKYCGQTNIEKIIDPNLVQPFIIQEVGVKAKKRQ